MRLRSLRNEKEDTTKIKIEVPGMRVRMQPDYKGQRQLRNRTQPITLWVEIRPKVLDRDCGLQYVCRLMRAGKM